MFCAAIGCESENERLGIFNAGGQKPITSSVSKKMNTVSILFGNEQAMESAIKGLPFNGDEIFTLVTWNQEHKKFWYPGLINGRVKSIEVVKMTLLNNKVQPFYKLIEGQAPYSQANRPFTKWERIQYITRQKASIYP